MRIRGKRYRQAVAAVAAKRYGLEEGIHLLKTLPKVKFDETVTISIRLGIDPKKTEQAVRGAAVLPKGTGKSVRILVFAEGEKAKEAETAGAAIVGGKELVDKVSKGFLDFDVALAHVGMMRDVGKLGRVLGPKGLMPSPKSGTVTEDIARAVQEFKAGKVEFRSDAGGNVHVRVGKLSFAEEDLRTNIHTFIEPLAALRPPTAKGVFIQSVVLQSSMSPGIPLAITAGAA
ncbi:MAG: 50S ribosomal protein L1 [Planctomycetota bacterium]